MAKMSDYITRRDQEARAAVNTPGEYELHLTGNQATWLRVHLDNIDNLLREATMTYAVGGEVRWRLGECRKLAGVSGVDEIKPDGVPAFKELTR